MRIIIPHVERRKDPLSIDAALGKKVLKGDSDKKNMANAHAQPSLHEIQSILSIEVLHLVPVHGHALRTSAQFPVCGWADRPASSHAACCTAFLECQQLFGSECLVVDLAGGFDEILQVCSGEEIPEIDKFAVILILDIDDAPLVLATTNLLAINNDSLLASHHCKRDDVLDSAVCSPLLIIQLFVVVWIHLKVVESEFLLDALFERTSFLEGQGVSFRNHRDNVDDVREFLENDNIDRLESVTGWLDEEETAVNTCVLNVAFALGGELFTEVGRVLIFDVFDDRVPAGRKSANELAVAQ